ncbi:hypothetical protein VTL71DRAFT_9779 [Oculimacula yallundae]|uniref:Uncharacterized protein n=1 Tax=Oculimacula yallundae TaxID=86028 RepID=A0ABR4BRU8_9HELO
MQFSTLLILTLPLLAAAVPQDNCRHGLTYCGDGLLRKGNYLSDIINSLNSANQPTDQNHINYSLFACKGDDDVPFKRYCGVGRCVDGASGQSDRCS